MAMRESVSKRGQEGQRASATNYCFESATSGRVVDDVLAKDSNVLFWRRPSSACDEGAVTRVNFNVVPSEVAFTAASGKRCRHVLLVRRLVGREPHVSTTTAVSNNFDRLTRLYTTH